MDQPNTPITVPEHAAEIVLLKQEQAAALAAAAAEYQTKLDHMGERYRLGVEAQQKDHDELTAKIEQLKQERAAEIATLKEAHENQLADVQAAHDRQFSELHQAASAAVAKAEFQAGQYRLAHDAAMAILSESPEARSLRAQHAKDAAELAAKQESDRQALAAKMT